MTKRFTSMILAIALLMAVCIPAVLAEDDTPSASAGYYYVYTENGKGLNVRDAPNGKKVGSLKYGTRVYCYYKDGGNGWALIDYKYDNGFGLDTYAAYISSRYLQKTKPAPRSSSSATSGTKAPSTATATATAAGTMAEINAEFASARTVTPYMVTVRPTRASGWVNLRWAPSKSAQLMATYKANDQLLVIKETTNWLQVEDQDTGDVGFINKSFVSK